ncbi:fluoride efflux transporter CrcB [Roseovarius sp. M141]|uniref:fluoride efflux transporter CrcB n=1 Tax=Roseovarius sp. M141 TaxID=2583806 RepID=UPI0020CE95F6|nr:fluoride efflux transporter CrcB [Roseovarius sp. M141]MCQ0091122.1 fluoride efflux transporter CrcB [Roseovarius sp. M141]
MFMTFLHVALGGAIGASLRFGAGLWLARMAIPNLPLAVMSVNVIGSFLMGAFAVWSLERGHEALNPFVMTGILGGFTTFSAFSLEVLTLIELGEFAMALLYVALSVGLSIGALALGLWLMRGVLA